MAGLTPRRPRRNGRGGQVAVARHRRRRPLGNTTSIASRSAGQALTPADLKRRDDRRDARFALRDMLAEHTTIDRQRWCSRRRLSGRNPEVRVRAGIAHMTGVIHCGSVWSCPVCSPRIRQERANEAERAARWWLAANGPGTVHLLTLTVPHDAGVRLAVSFDVVRQAYRELFSGRARVDDRARFGLAHYIRAHDFTVGANGWHPHIHALLFTTRALDADDVAALGDRLHERWVRSVTRRGLRAPSREHGTKLETARDVSDVARYALQVCVGAEGERARPAALELMRSDLKRSRHDGHRPPWEVLEDFHATGDDDDLQLWHEYEQATQGKHATQWSRGLHQLVDVVERTDEEIVAEEVGGDVVFTFTRGHDVDLPYVEWQAVARTRGALRAVLAAAEAGWRDGGIDAAAIAVTTAVELIYRRFRLSRGANARRSQALVAPG